MLKLQRMDDDSSSACTQCDTTLAHLVCSLFCEEEGAALAERGYTVHVDESYVHGDGFSVWFLKQSTCTEPTLEHMGLPGLFLAARVERKTRHYRACQLPDIEPSHTYAQLWAAQQSVLQCLEGAAGIGHDIVLIELLPTMLEVKDWTSFSIPIQACVLPLTDNDEEQLQRHASMVASLLSRIFWTVYADAPFLAPA